MDNDDVETQWTKKARRSYEDAAEALIDALRAHMQLNLDRSGHQREMAAYIGSARQLTAAAGALNDAEFDWCGSFPLALDTEDSDSESDFEDDDGEGEPVDMLAFVGRWDFRVTDEKAVLRSGRRAYRRAWPKDSKKDAQHRVYNMESAASEILHANGLAGLEAAKGMSLERWVNTFVALPAGASDTFDSDPFSIASQDDV